MEWMAWVVILFAGIIVVVVVKKGVKKDKKMDKEYDSIIFALRVLIETVAKENDENVRKKLGEAVRIIVDKLSYLSPGKLARLEKAREDLNLLAEIRSLFPS
jgi:hypothetical protein